MLVAPQRLRPVLALALVPGPLVRLLPPLPLALTPGFLHPQLQMLTAHFLQHNELSKVQECAHTHVTGSHMPEKAVQKVPLWQQKGRHVTFQKSTNPLQCALCVIAIINVKGHLLLVVQAVHGAQVEGHDALKVHLLLHQPPLLLALPPHLRRHPRRQPCTAQHVNESTRNANRCFCFTDSQG